MKNEEWNRRDCEMAPQVKALVIKPGILSSILKTHMLGEKEHL